MTNAAMKVSQVGVLLVGLFTIGCESTDLAVQQANLTPQEEKQFRQAQTKTRAQGTALGALVGAGIGYAVGGGWEGAVAGAVTGGTAGAIAGEKKAQTQGRILVSERQLDQLIAKTQDTNAQLRARVADLSAQRRAFQSRISSAKSSGDKRELSKVKKEMQSSLASSETLINAGTQRVNYNNTVDGKSAAKQSLLRSETQKLDSATRELQQEHELFASLYNSIDV